MSGCTVFVFLSLMEYALVNYALRGAGRRKRKMSSAVEVDHHARQVT